MNLEEFVEYIYSLYSNLSLGFHGIGKKRNEKNKGLSNIEIAEKILEKGLETDRKWGLLGTVQKFGQIKDLDSNKLKKILNYAYMADEDRIVNVIFAFPESITTSEGKEMYLGHYDYDLEFDSKYGKYSKLPLNVLAQRAGYVPREFILGYCISQFESDEIIFIKNPYFLKEGYADEIAANIKKEGVLTGQDMLEVKTKFPAFKDAVDEVLLEQYLNSDYYDKGISL